MKQLLMITALLLTTAITGFSQVDLGFSTGLNVSNIHIAGASNDFLPKRNFITTFRPALTANIALDERFSIYTGVATEARGFDVSVGTDLGFLGVDLPIGVTAKTRISYLEVPLNIRMNFQNATGKVRPWIAAGANLGYAYSGEIRTVANVLFDINLANTPINLDNENIRRFDVAPNITAGLDIPYKRGNFTFAIGYEHSVQNFLEDALIGIETRHFGFTPSIGYSYTLGLSPKVQTTNSEHCRS